MDPIHRKIHEVTVGAVRGQAAQSRAKATGQAAPPPAAAPLPDVIARRLRAISADDPERGRKAVRAFLESVLAAELGDAVTAIPQFDSVVDKVQHLMEHDAELASMLESAVQELLARAATTS